MDSWIPVVIALVASIPGWIAGYAALKRETHTVKHDTVEDALALKNAYKEEVDGLRSRIENLEKALTDARVRIRELEKANEVLVETLKGYQKNE